MTRIFRIDVDGATGWLATMARPEAGDTDDLRGLGVRHLVCMLETDEIRDLGLRAMRDECTAVGVAWHHVPVADRGVPTGDDARAMLQLAMRLASAVRAGEPVVTHCRGGIGRSTLMAALVLRVLGYSADDALDAIRHARGCPVPDTPEQREWLRRVELPSADDTADESARDAFNRLFE